MTFSLNGGTFQTPGKANIGDQKANIEQEKANIDAAFTAKTASWHRRDSSSRSRAREGAGTDSGHIRRARKINA
jgi:hypothetical protein